MTATTHRAPQPRSWLFTELKHYLMTYNLRAEKAEAVKAERERIARMADDVTAVYLVGPPENIQMRSFAELIREGAPEAARRSDG